MDSPGFLRKVIAMFPRLVPCAVTACKVSRQCREVLWPNSLLRNVAGLKLNVIRIEGYRNTFVGYYDVAPFRPGDPAMLILHCNSLSASRRPSMRHRTDIVLHDRNAQTHRTLDSTRTWNWQQGCRLQWVDADHVIYNDYHPTKGKVLAVLRSVKDADRTVLPVNLNALYRDEYVLSLDYYALSRHTEYGYPGLPETASDREVKRYSFATGAVDALFNVEDVKRVLGRQGLKKEHINHVLVSPRGEHFVFIYRFYDSGQRIDNLLLYSFREGKLRLLVPQQVISHCTWRDADRVLFWGIMDSVPGFYLLDIRDAVTTLVVPARHDTHPTFLDDHTILGDSYPSLHTGLHSLFVMNMDSRVRRDLLTLSHPVVYSKACRCDMHPGISEDAKHFQIDTRYEGNRSVIIGELAGVRP